MNKNNSKTIKCPCCGVVMYLLSFAGEYECFAIGCCYRATGATLQRVKERKHRTDIMAMHKRDKYIENSLKRQIKEAKEDEEVHNN